MRELFRKWAQRVAESVGTPWAFMVAVGAVILWAISGPIFHFSDTWQLVINTATTVVTFLMIFLVQNTQNRDARAIHLKLDELIRAQKGARNELVDLEDLSDKEIDRIAVEFQSLRERLGDAAAPIVEQVHRQISTHTAQRRAPQARTRRSAEVGSTSKPH